MSLSFLVMNPRVKFIINHYRETYSSIHYPILLQDFGWFVCKFSRFLWKASFIFLTLSTWFISLLGLLWWNRITKSFFPWKFCPCALRILSIWKSRLSLNFLWCLLTFFYVNVSVGANWSHMFKLHWKGLGPIPSPICTNCIRKGWAQYLVRG